MAHLTDFPRRISAGPAGNELSLVSIWTFLPFVARFGFPYQQEATTSNAMFKWKHPQKNQNGQQKAITSIKRHLPVFGF